MFNSWKSQIVVQTLAPYALGFSFFCLYLAGVPVIDILENWERLLAIGLLATALAMIQDLVPKALKESLVFWRMSNRLPGHRAFCKGRTFSSVIDREEVVDIGLREALSERTQDRLFYRLYDKYRDKSNVKHYSFRYLQWRELASLAIVCGPIGSYFVYASSEGWGLRWVPAMIISIIVCFLSIFAARSSSASLIDYVLLSERLEVDGE